MTICSALNSFGKHVFGRQFGMNPTSLGADSVPNNWDTFLQIQRHRQLISDVIWAKIKGQSVLKSALRYRIVKYFQRRKDKCGTVEVF